MIYIPDLSSVHCLGDYCLRYAYALWSIIPLLIVLFYFIRANFVKFFNRAEQESYAKEKKSLRILIFVIRSLTLACIVIAIASPFTSEPRKVQGDSTLTILVDNSSSFSLFESGIGEDLAKNLKGSLPVKLNYIAYGEHSNLGNGILNNVESDSNLLVITDGNNNEGRLLGDMILFASSLNATISTLDMQPIKSDVAVTIEGPSDVIKDTVEQFYVKVKNAGKELSYHLEVDIDGEVVLGKDSKGTKEFEISKKLSGSDYHKITARLTEVSNDYFQQNNVFYKSVKIVQRPSILFVSNKDSQLYNSLSQIYDTTRSSQIPNDLSNYFTVILDDINIADINSKVDLLSDYVSDGNGLIVVGGKNSYDRGGYKKSIFETLLPVRVGAGEEEEKSDVQIVIIADVSGTTGIVYNAETGMNEYRNFDQIIKALAISILDSLNLKNNVGVVVVGAYAPPHVGYVTKDIKPLAGIKDDLEDKISRLNGGGQTVINSGILAANNLLMQVGGSRNIILISDGRGLYSLGKEEVKNTVKNINARGVKFYVVGVGAKEQQDQDFLSDIASLGQGIYFPAGASNRLKIIFGEPEGKEEEYLNTLIILDTNHFITSNLDISAVISGYNYVIPKPAARLLVSTNKKIPVITAWRFGLGRVVSIATDDGSAWAGEMLLKENSKLITRSVNWAVGNPNRKKGFDVSAEDTSLGKAVNVQVISNEMPESDKLSFSKIDANLYSGDLNIDKAGFHDIMGATFAVNYNTEHGKLGMNEEFINVVKSTGGFVFDPDDTENIIETIRSISKRTRLETVYYKWPFILVALMLFLIDVTIRRLKEYKIKFG